MTVSIQRMTGYGNFSQLITYVTAFHEIFGLAGGLKFLPESMDGIVDVYETGEMLMVCSYPHNKANIQALAEKHQAKIKETLAHLYKEGHRKVFTLNLTEDTVRVVKKEDFANYYPSRELRTEMFIRNVGSSEGGFPQIYVITDSTRYGAHSQCLPIFASSSHEVSPCASTPTELGKKFVYILYNSWKHGKFTTDCPELKSIRFPTRTDSGILPTLNTAVLENLAEKISDELVETTNGNALLSPAPKDGATNPVTSIADTIYRPVEPDVLEPLVREQIRHNGSVNLTDIMTIGLSQVLALIETPERIVDVILDIGGVVKRMCLFEGMAHVLPPASSEFDVEEFFGEPGDLFHICTEDNFPKRGFLNNPNNFVQ